MLTARHRRGLSSILAVGAGALLTAVAFMGCGNVWCSTCPEPQGSTPPPSSPERTGNTGGADAAVAVRPDGGGSDASTPEGGDAPTLPSCKWPSTLNPPDASNAGWSVSRTLLDCPSAGGDTVVCGSDSATSACPGAALPCVMECAANQYLVTEHFGVGYEAKDGAPPPSPNVYPTLPAACAPGGGFQGAEATYYCCLCE
jgi:hypothetical protein